MPRGPALCASPAVPSVALLPVSKARPCSPVRPKPLAASLLILCVPRHAPALAALPAGVTQGRQRRRRHEYTLANGLSVLLFPDATQADDHRRRHVQGRLAPGELRRDRHGAPARAHAVQGHAVDAEHLRRSSAAAACSSTARRRTTAPTISRRSPRPTRTRLGAEDGGRADDATRRSRKRTSTPR